MQPTLWMAAAGSAALALLSGVADWRRHRRSNLDRPGFMPWPLIQVMAMLCAIITAALAMKG